MMKKQNKQTIIPAVFESQIDADDAISLLHQMGLTDRDIAVSAVHPTELQSEGVLDVAAERSVERNALVGGIYGFFAGAVIAALYMYSQHFFGLSGIWIGGIVGILAGVTQGAFWGLALTEMHWTARSARQSRNALHEGEVLVTVQPGARYKAVREMLKNRGVHTFLDPGFYPQPTGF
ncbi:MAG: hypothetical protein KDE46_30040 [Caldilineaceae bacterium]|nr:hypothetical protein [Caldilineaceae bacterium]